MLGKQNFSERHIWSQARLSEYLDQQIAPAERAQLETHLTECAECRTALASLRWTIALVQQAPAPALPRSFTLPVPAQRAASPTFVFGLARFATALATLLLIAVIGVDVILQFSGGVSMTTALAPQTDKQVAAPVIAPTLQAVAAPLPTSAPKPLASPTQVAPAAEVAKPTQVAKPTSALSATMSAPAAAPIVRATLPAPAPSMPPLLGAMPTITIPLGIGGGAPETPGTADAAKARSITPVPRASTGNAITATLTLPPPTATLAPMATLTATPSATAQPSPTPVAQARTEPTRAPQPTRVPAAIPQPLAAPLRWVEIGLFFLVVFFATLTLLLWRKK